MIPLSFIFYLFAQNANRVKFTDILLTLWVVLICSGALFLLFYAISRSWAKAAILTSSFSLLFFNLDSIARTVVMILAGAGRDSNLTILSQVTQYCLVALGILFAGIFLATLFSSKELYRLNRFANVFSIGMILISLGSMFVPAIQRIILPTPAEGFNERWQDTLAAEPEALQPTDPLPDIYYIILDEYGRADVLDQFYDFDNQPFLDALAGRGFFIASESLTNYKQTNLSIASALNLDYINWIEADFGDAYDYQPLTYLTNYNRVFTQLRRLGYRIDTFATGFAATEIETADQVFHPAYYPNQFEMLVINTTPLGYLWNSRLHEIHRERVRYTLRNLAEAGNQPGPDFVFAHVFSPHPPFVFGPNGESITPGRAYTYEDAADFLKIGSLEEYRSGYADQVAYLNREVLAAVDEILENSSVPPIIILQGDHGPGSQSDFEFLARSNLFERYPILNAYYLPCGEPNALPVDITPVNSFRYIFNHCFEAGLPYLENRSYFSSKFSPYVLTDVTGQINPAK